MKRDAQKRKNSRFAFLLVTIGIGIGVLLNFNACTNEESPNISYINDVEKFCQEYNLSNIKVGGLQYYQIDDNRVFVLDQRNPDMRLYINSKIEASIEQNGILTVRVIDSDAISENDISGNYGVLITSKTVVSEIKLEQEDKTK